MSRFTDNAEKLPWVTRRKRRGRCLAYVNPPLSVYFGDRPRSNVRSTDLEDYRCKNSAHWFYKSTKDMWWVDTGLYCWSHLVSILQSMNEVKRQEKWREEE